MIQRVQHFANTHVYTIQYFMLSLQVLSKMRFFLYIFIVFTAFGCTNYQKVVKHGTPVEKLAAAKKYYNKKDYSRAKPLFEELLTLYYNKTEFEEIQYYYAYTHYGLQEYLLASFYFDEFIQKFPLSKRREEAAYTSAACNYYKALRPALDQTNTLLAINALQVFINQYPNSSYVKESNEKIDELRNNILLKTYNNAKLFYNISSYKAAMVACKNAIDDYPDMINTDELSFYIVDAAYQYAKNSVLSVQKERYTSVLEYANDFFAENKEDSKYYKKVKQIVADTQKELAYISKEINTTDVN